MRRSLALGLAALALACAPRVRVTTSALPGADVASFESYALVPPAEARSAVRATLEAEVARELDARGYRAAPLGTSELRVVVQTRARTAQRAVFGESPGGCCVVRDYVEGTLEIDVFAAQGGTRIWRGVGQVDLDSTADRELGDTAARAARAVLADLPRRSAAPAGQR